MQAQAAESSGYAGTFCCFLKRRVRQRGSKLYYRDIFNEELEIPAGFSPCELAAPRGRHLKFVAQPQRVYRVPRAPYR
jgi:hypothetical protein